MVSKSPYITDPAIPVKKEPIAIFWDISRWV
jgi:hypothetical protein